MNKPYKRKFFSKDHVKKMKDKERKKEQAKREKKKQKELKKRPNYQPPPKDIDVSKIKYINQYPELRFNKRAKGQIAFWDSKRQADNARNYMKSRGLDNKNLEVKRAVREFYRKKVWGNRADIPKGEPLRNFIGFEDYNYEDELTKIEPGSNVVETINNVILPDMLQIEKNKKFKGNSNKDKAKQNNEDKPDFTGKVWKGEIYDPESCTWSEPEEGARDDYFEWYNTFILPEISNALPLGAIHEEWSEEIDSDDKLIMLKPRDHYKTSFLTIGLATLCLCEPSRKLFPVLTVSKAELNTKDTMLAIRMYLERNERILSFYGYVIDEKRPNDKNSLFTIYQDIGAKDPALYCATFGSNLIMGTHPMLAILDDIENKALTKALMYQGKNLLDKSLLAGMPKNSKILLVGTLKGFDHTNDIYLYAKKKGVFSCYEDPAVYKINPKTGDPILDNNGDKIYGMPDMKLVSWKHVKVQQFHEDGTPILSWKGKPKFKKDIVVTIKNNADKEWKSIYSERYTVIDIIKKRILLREVDKKNDDTFWSEFFLRPCNPSGNFFDAKRVNNFPPRNHATTMAYFNWIKEMKIPTVIWIDPGGKGGHGIAMVCMLFWKGETHIIDMIVIKQGTLAAAIKIAEWRELYGVQIVGCEGNFSQKETYAEVIDRELYRHCMEQKIMDCYVRISPFFNKGNKILRIQTNIKIISGFHYEESLFYVNQDSKDIEQFRNEFKFFPNLLPGSDHEWDLIDGISSAQIHLYDLSCLCDEIFSYS